MKTIDEKALDRFAMHIRAKGRQPATVDSYRRDCEAFLTFLDAAGVHQGNIEPRTLEEFQSFLKNKGSKENSVRRSVIGVRQFFRYLQDEQGWNHSPFDDVAIPERDDQFKHRISAETIAELFKFIALESSPLKGRRDDAMLNLLAHEGLKAAELIELEWADFLETSHTGVLRIRGARSRTIHLEAATTIALSRLKKILRQKEFDHMTIAKAKIMIGFKGIDARHALSGLSRHGVKFALYELGSKVGIAHLNSEDLRHFAMAHKVFQGFSPEMLMNHLGLRTPGKMIRHFPDVLSEPGDCDTTP